MYNLHLRFSCFVFRVTHANSGHGICVGAHDSHTSARTIPRVPSSAAGSDLPLPGRSSDAGARCIDYISLMHAKTNARTHTHFCYNSELLDTLGEVTRGAQRSDPHLPLRLHAASYAQRGRR